MAEVKRPKLISIDSERTNNKNTNEIHKTIRISVVLTESTEDSFPEYNYQDELLAVTKKCSKIPATQSNELDPFNEDDEDVRRVAAQMEAKYGVGASKKRKYRKDDFADIGMGYDESDSFIDNTDGYDEIIPKNVTTVHGGFYINCGALEFKTDEGVSSDDSPSSEDETSEKVSKQKRIIESSAASEEDLPDKDKPPEKKPKFIGLNGMQKAIKKRLFGHDKIKQIRKKRSKESKRTISELLKERNAGSELVVSDFVDITEEPSPDSGINKPANTVNNVIESVINAIKAKESLEDPKKDVYKESTNWDKAVNLAHPISEGESSDGGGMVKSPMEYTQLPENLPSDIVEIISSLKSAAASSTEGKVKFFTGNVNLLLLNLEKKCRCLGKRSRNKVYEHLAPFVKCRKETLIKRAKNLVLIDEKKRLKILLDKLQCSVKTVMPSIIKSYEDECSSVSQKKLASESDANKNIRMPKRYFPWTEDTKKMLRDIISLKKRCILNEGKQKESVEDNLVAFLKSEVQIIWPEGWMSMNALMKYCNLARDKKSLDGAKKSSSSIILDVKNNLESTSHISINCNSGITITPVTTSVNSNCIDTKLMSTVENETIITRVNSDISNTNKPKIVSPLPPPDIKNDTETDHSYIKYNSNSNCSTTVISPKEELTTKQLVVKEDRIKTNDVHTSPKEISVGNGPDKLTVKETDVGQVSVCPQEPIKDTSQHVSIIDLTDTPELIRKPGPKSKNKYFLPDSSNSMKFKKESSNLSDECSPTSAHKKTVTDCFDSNKPSTHHSSHHSGINSHSSSIIKNSFDYYKPKSIAANEYNLLKQATNDLSKLRSTATDLTKIKSTATDISRMKSQPNDFSKIRSSSDYNHRKVISEGEDIQNAMDSLMMLQKLSSPVKPKDDSRSSSAVSVINYNKSNSIDSRHILPTPISPTDNGCLNRSTSFQDAFQNQFIADLNLVKTSQVKGNYNSHPKYNHLNHKSIAASNDRYLQNSNHIYQQHNSNSKLKSGNCSSSQSASSKSSTHQK